MKTIALIPARNEESMLRVTLPQIKRLADEIILLEDGSTDKTVDVAKEHGVHVFHNDEKTSTYWDEYHIRERMLELGRKMGGTHFICLDADEYPTEPFVKNSKKLLSQLKPGQKLFMQWIALWKSTDKYRDDNSVWSNLHKDFAVCDDEKITHTPAKFGVGRTPGTNSKETTVKITPQEGAILHLQFTPWTKFQMKQARYRCAELIAQPKKAKKINYQYSITLDDPNAKLKPLPKEWVHAPIPKSLEQLLPDWNKDAIIEYFDKYGIEFFEPLQIWHIQELRDEFIKQTGREPIPKTYGKAVQLSRKIALKIYSNLPNFLKKQF